MNIGEWESSLLAVSKRRNEQEEARFLELVDEACNRCSLPVARVLMKTFSDIPDFGTQERVFGALATAPEEVALQAELEELPRLLREAPEWAETIIGGEVEHRHELLQSVAKTMSAEVKLALRQLLGKAGFREFHANAARIRI